MGIEQIGRLLIFFGIILVIIGALFLLFGKIPWLGRLPGDIVIQRDKFTFYFPIVTMLLISLILTIIFNLIARLR